MPCTSSLVNIESILVLERVTHFLVQMAEDGRRTLESDLRALAQAARAEHPAVQEAAEHAIVRLRSLPPAVCIRDAPDSLRPFLLACHHATGGVHEAAMVSRALEAIQRIAAASELPAQVPPDIVRVLAIQVR